jgi:pimeloyl-ACP methyl ester carboxylesterase
MINKKHFRLPDPILAIFFFLLVFQSCKVSVPPGISMDTWYISDAQSLAVKFDSPRKGQYITLNRAIANPRPFRVRQSGNITRFRLSDNADIRGRLSVYHDKFYLVTQDDRIEFRQYYTRAFPRPPYRYQDGIFREIEITEVTYGKASGFYSSKTIEKRENKSYNQVLFEVAEGITTNILRREVPLEMDIYQPVEDHITSRPVVVLLHAGAFIAGDKRDELVSTLAADYARRGFVVASVNYRLGYLFLPGRYSNLERAMFSAVQDVRAALRYLSHHHKEFGIDPDIFFLGGHSAGGILSLLTTFMDETEVWSSARGSVIRFQPDLGCLDCSTNDLYGPFSIKGLINMWGALDNVDIIKPHNQTPILSIHGDDDKVVPYGHDYPFTNVSARVSAFFSRRIHGSESILNHTSRMGIDHTLYTFEGLGHEPHFDADHKLIPENYEIINTQILSFLNNLIIQPLDRIKGPFTLSQFDFVPEYRIIPDNYNEYFFQCDDCLIIAETPISARIVWLDGNENYELRVAGTGKQGQIAADTIQVNIVR